MDGAPGQTVEDSFKSLGDLKSYSEVRRGAGCSAQLSGNCFEASWLGTVLVPVLRNYLLGIDYLKFDVEQRKCFFFEWKYFSCS